jgi:hypothetical protein
MVSFTFDDVPKSAATVGAPILEAYNARGTFYVAGGLVDRWSGHWIGASPDEIGGLHRSGYELACHTFSHRQAIDLDAAAMAAEMEKNRSYFLTLDPSIRMENFAYPYGLGSLSRKRQLSKIFRSSRGILPGVNSGAVDLHYLRAMPLVDLHVDAGGIDRAFDEAVEKKRLADFLQPRRRGYTQPLRMLAVAAAPCPGDGVAPESPRFDHCGRLAPGRSLAVLFRASGGREYVGRSESGLDLPRSRSSAEIISGPGQIAPVSCRHSQALSRTT